MMPQQWLFSSYVNWPRDLLMTCADYQNGSISWAFCIRYFKFMLDCLVSYTSDARQCSKDRNGQKKKTESGSDGETVMGSDARRVLFSLAGKWIENSTKARKQWVQNVRHYHGPGLNFTSFIENNRIWDISGRICKSCSAFFVYFCNTVSILMLFW